MENDNNIQDVAQQLIESPESTAEGKVKVLEEEKARLRKRLEQLVAEEELKEVKAEGAQIKTLTEILQDENTPVEVFVSSLNAKIKVCKFTLQDLIDTINLDSHEFMREAIYRMWSKADKSVTREEIAKLPSHIIQDIYNAVDKKCPFLSPQQLEKLVLLETIGFLESLTLRLKAIQVSQSKSLESTQLSSFPGSLSTPQNPLIDQKV